MPKYLDFETHEKGYEPFNITKENLNKNKGRQICFVNKRSIDKYRGYYNVDTGIISGTRYCNLFLDDNEKCVDIRDIVEAGIKIIEPIAN